MDNNDLDMSRPGNELFPDPSQLHYNSYEDVNNQVVTDPLNMGATQQAEVADQQRKPESDQQLNFKALREEVSKMQSEREYWKGQAEAYSRQNQQPEPKREDPLEKIDWDDTSDLKKAFHAIRQENQQLRNEIQDSFKALETKTQRADWNDLVSQNVPQLTSKNPIFAEMIKNVSNPYEAAYLLAELNSKASQTGQNQPPPSPLYGNGQRAISNAAKPQTLASVGGQGQLSAADYYASMSDKEFMDIAARNLANI